MSQEPKKKNTEKRVPKGDITYKVSLTEEQRDVKRECFNYKMRRKKDRKTDTKRPKTSKETPY